MSWYVINIETGKEDIVCNYINQLDNILFQDVKYSLFVPKRKLYERKQGVIKEVIRKLFPGYILIETDEIIEFYNKSKKIPHTLHFLRNNNVFLEVQHDEIDKILCLSDNKGLVDISKAQILDNRIIITDGPLFQREGIVKKIDKRKGRAKIEFNLNGKILLIDLGVSIMTSNTP